MGNLFASKELQSARESLGKFQKVLNVAVAAICLALQRDPVEGDVEAEAAATLFDEMQAAFNERAQTISTLESEASTTRTALAALLPAQEGEDTRTLSELVAAVGGALSAAQAASSPEAILKKVNAQLQKAGAEPVARDPEATDPNSQAKAPAVTSLTGRSRMAAAIRAKLPANA